MAVEGRTHKPVIDRKKCGACAVCVGGCPAEIILEQREEVDSLRGRIYRQLYPEKRPEPSIGGGKAFGEPPCQAACPIHQDARGYVTLIAGGRYVEAAQLIREANALPSVCGYVCHRPCEEQCVRGLIDQPVRIKELKRFIADRDEGKQPPHRIKRLKGKKVSIVGSGPAGLAAAYDLARNGFQVEIVEALPEPGGMLRWAIPSFRLPLRALRRDIRYITDLGVKIKTGVKFGVDVSLSDLREGGATAIILAIGTQEGLKPRIENSEHANGYIDCLTFLRRFANGERMDLGSKVVVIGAGNAAIDSARSALRCGAKEVIMMARRGREHVAADKHEVEQARIEGVSMLFWTMPISIVAQAGEIRQVTCVRTRMSGPDSHGRRRPVPIPGSEFPIDATTVISATGQRPDLSWNKEGLALTLSPENTFIVDEGGMTTVAGVFAAGDAVSGSTTVVEAMASGRRVAHSVSHYLLNAPSG